MIEQKEPAKAQDVYALHAGYVFSNTAPGGKKSSEWWAKGEPLPYPFNGLEDIVAKCDAINLAVLIDGVLYQFQSVSVSPTPNLRSH